MEEIQTMEELINKPHLIRFSKIGESHLGYLSIAEFGHSVPFEIKRVFWAYFTPEDVIRGFHAHHETEMILIAAAGKITVKTEDATGEVMEFQLERPNEGLYLPKLCWHTMQYSHNAVQLVLTSSHYAAEDYIRDYDEFKKTSA